MKQPRLLWLWLWLVLNFSAFLIMLNAGEMIGDFAGYPVVDVGVLFLATAGVMLTYYFILSPFFNFMSKIKIPIIGVNNDIVFLQDRLGLLLFVLQIAFMIFNLTEGVNIAGSGNVRSGSIFSFLWIFLPVDVLFLIYYSFFRESKYFKLNLIIWLISNIMRGWAGVFLAVIFFELIRHLKKKQVKWLWIMAATILVAALYPLINIIKWTIRGYSSLDASDVSMMALIAGGLSSGTYFDLVVKGVEHIAGRIQTVAVLAETYRIRDVISTGFYSGDFVPFWKEGLLGIAYDTIFSGARGMTLSVMFPLYDDLGSINSIGDWNLNTSFLSWLVILPEYSPIYIFYIVFTCFLSILFYKMIPGYKPDKLDGLWFAWLVYLLPPWWAAFTGYIYCLMLFLLMIFLLDRLPRFKI
jgi:hypothetical protein